MGEATRARPVGPVPDTPHSRSSPFGKTGKSGAKRLFASIQGKTAEMKTALLDSRRGCSKSAHQKSSNTVISVNDSLCELCKNIELNDKRQEGRLKPSGDGKKYVDFPKSELSLTYKRRDTFPTLPSISKKAAAGCPLCQLLKISFTKYFEDDSKGLVGLKKLKIKGLEYRWDSGLRGLMVDFRCTGPGRTGDHHIEFPIEAFADPGQGSSTQFLRISRRPRYGCLIQGQEFQLLPEVTGRIEDWIETCRRECGQNNKPVVSPKRLLDVGSNDGTGKIRLLECTQQTSQNGTHQVPKYAALSYCWGNKPPLMTMTENLDEMLDGISFEKLPRNYRDAIIVCRSLKIQYLWIDSLCIIQGDKIDWESESPKMAQYYEQAYITIIPAAATSCYDGFLERSTSTTPSVKVGFKSRLNPKFHGTYLIGHDFTVDRNFSLFYQDIAESKWGTRGWTFCEGLFSKRRVYFGKNTIHWSCERFYANELSNHLGNAEEDNIESLIKEMGEENPLAGRNFLSMWHTQYLEYSMRELSRSQDRLPAISPLAQVVANMTKKTGEEYLAGVWKSDLEVGLLWYASKFEGRIVLPNEKERPYIAPSWSWLARAKNAEISHYVLTHETRSALKILDARTTLDGINPFGRVLDGYIKVQGQICELPGESLFKVASERRTNYREIRSDGRYVGECSLDLDETHAASFGDYQLQMPGSKAQNFLLLVIRDGLCLKNTMSRAGKDISENEAYSAVSGLVLIPSGRGNADEYCRMGIFESPPIDGGGVLFFKDCERRTITII